MLLINGEIASNAAYSGNFFPSAEVNVGAGLYSGNMQYIKGYIDEFRISNIARWTSDFTPQLEKALLVVTMSDKGGSGSGIRPYELLEAVLASCMNISLRIQAEKEGIELEEVETTVSVNRNINGKTIFEYECTILDELDKQTIERIKSILQNCLIRKILSNQIEFEETSLN